jgi:hypothetical protein
MQALGPNQERWLQALESGKYQQCESCLECDKHFCCLGVGCQVFFPEDRTETAVATSAMGKWFGETEVAPQCLIDTIGLHDSNGLSLVLGDKSLTELNDSGNTFPEIAAIVRANPEHYFTEPR